jgi:hypothetical protein
LADDFNECNASVVFTKSNQHADNQDIWTFTFHVKGGNGANGQSAGGFSYALTYVDQSNVPHPNTTFSGPSWSAGDGPEFDLTDDKNIPGAVSVSNFRVFDIRSGGCV